MIVKGYSMSEKERYATPRISMPESMLEKLDKIADSFGLSRSAFIRVLFMQFMKGSGSLNDPSQLLKNKGGKKN